jgi:hypothetical protein
MTIFISNSILPNRILISDNSKSENIDINDPIQLIFINGTVTIKIFKQMYLANIDAYFVVKNLEEFILKMKEFRNIQMVILDNNDNISNPFDCSINVTNNQRLKKYAKIEKKMKSRNIDKGIELSFRPRIFESVKTSLENCGIYMSKETIIHKIYKLLKESKKRLVDIEKIDESTEEVHKALKSLIFYGLVVKNDDSFEIAASIL